MADTTKLLAIALVAVIVVGGVAAFLVLGGDDDGDKKEITGRLQVYGNVDNDDHIDSDDLKAFDNMKDNWDREKYPYADANRDGVLDDKDKEIIQKLVNGESCDVLYINGLGEVAEVRYPVKKIGIAGTMVHPVINALGAGTMAVAKAGKSTALDPLLDSPTYNLPSIGPRPYEIDKELLGNYEIDAVITLYSTTYNAVEDALKGTPVQCIRVNPESSDMSLNTYLLMGFLLQKTERSDTIVSFYDKYNKIIADKIDSLKEKKTTLTMYSYSMCGTEYYLTKNTIDAGTINLSDFSDKNTKSLKDDMGAWAAVDKYQADYIIQYQGWSVRWDNTMDEAEQFLYYGKYFTKMNAYPENYIVVNKTMPDIARTAFVMGTIYDEIGTDFAYDLYEDLIKTFYPYIEDYDVRTDAICFIDYDMVKEKI